MSQSPTPIRRGADARDTEAFAKQIAASLLTQNDAPQPVSPVPETKKPLIEMHAKATTSAGPMSWKFCTASI